MIREVDRLLETVFASSRLYVRAERSEVFPEVDLDAIARYAAMSDQHAALRAFRDELRASPR